MALTATPTSTPKPKKRTSWIAGTNTETMGLYSQKDDGDNKSKRIFRVVHTSKHPLDDTFLAEPYCWLLWAIVSPTCFPALSSNLHSPSGTASHGRKPLVRIPLSVKDDSKRKAEGGTFWNSRG